MTPNISVLVDNDSWILPYAESLVREWTDAGYEAGLWRQAEDLPQRDVAFFLGCVQLVRPEILKRHQWNLAVHESALPEGRGFAPVAWQMLEGRQRIPVVLIEATEQADSGDIFLEDELRLEGHELMPEVRHRQGEVTQKLCREFISRFPEVKARPQSGEGTWYARRRPQDSQLDVNRTLAEQFNLLRTVDNERYPAFFEYAGHTYRLKIEKAADRTETASILKGRA